MSREIVARVRSALSDPRRAAKALGLKVEDAGGGYVLVCCPFHGDRKPSFSLYRNDGIVRAKCHGCEWSGDMIDLAGALDGASGFREALAVACERAGLRDEAEAVRGGRGAPASGVVPARPAPESPERTYPPGAEVAALWEACLPVSEDADVSFELVRRLLDPSLVAELDVARAIGIGSSLPGWARYRGKSWLDTGHQMVLEAFDCWGVRRSVRAYRVTSSTLEAPKRLPPGGFKASGLVLANGPGRRLLSGELRVFRVIVVEGEPDFLVWSARAPVEPVLGLFSGSWHQGFGDRVPYGSEVIIRTHHDGAGDKYSGRVAETVSGRAVIRRSAA